MLTWSQIGTIEGICIRFDPAKAIPELHQGSNNSNRYVLGVNGGRQGYSQQKSRVAENPWCSSNISSMLQWNKMTIVVGYNESDSTYGWHRQSTGFTIFYSHFTSEHVAVDKSIPLSSGLMPVVGFKTIKRKYIGYPYTRCNNRTNPTNDYENYKVLLDEDVYSQRFGIYSGRQGGQPVWIVNPDFFCSVAPPRNYTILYYFRILTIWCI